MPVEIKVPTLGESVVEATVTRWLKKPGEAVAAGEPLVELETDKVNVEVPADSGGVLQQISQAEGRTVAVGAVLGLLGDAATAQAETAPPETTPPLEPSPDTTPPLPDTPTDNIRNGEGGLDNADLTATPLARAFAEENKVDLSLVKGTGPGGKITLDDVKTFLSRNVGPTPVDPGKIKPTVPEPPPPPMPPARPEERIKMTRRRQTIATRLVEAQHTAAMLTTFNEIDMSSVMEVRSRRKDAFKERYGVGLGFMSFFTKAAIGALKAFPLLNAEIQGDEIVKKGYYDIGIAVGAPEGLVVPVVRDADRRTFAGIEKEIGDLAKRARENKLTIAELQGGTFTLTNGGIFGSLMSTPILNAPQVGILGMHKIEERAVVVNKEIVIRPMMYVALSYDHRIVDGSEAVRFLVKIKELVEDPEALLLEG